MHKNVVISYSVSCHFDLLLDPQNCPLYYQGSTGVHNLPNAYMKFVLPENILISYFCCMEMQNCTQKSYIWSFWPILGPPNPHNGPLYYQGSTFRGSYCAKSLYKLVLSENIFISYFCGMEMHKMYSKVEYLVILTDFWTP